MAERKRIFVLLANQHYLEPISGDRINELNLITAMSKFLDVYYNGVRFRSGDKVAGSPDKKALEAPVKEKYDLAYIRANKRVFLDATCPKIWFASPYEKECFESADAIACMTVPWTERLRSYTPDDKEYFCDTYPAEMLNANTVYFPQAIEVAAAETGRSPADSSRKKLKPTWLDRARWMLQTPIKEKSSRHFTIRHFGPIRPSNNPTVFAEAVQCSFGSEISLEAVGAGMKVRVPKNVRVLGRVPKVEVPNLLKSSDAVWYSQDRSGNIAGSLKVLEAMAAGVPVLAPRWDARVYELGADYPLFWNPHGTRDQVKRSISQVVYRLVNLSDSDREELSNNLRQSAQRFSIDKCATVVNHELSRVGLI